MLDDFNYRAILLRPCKKIFLANKMHLNNWQVLNIKIQHCYKSLHSLLRKYLVHVGVDKMTYLYGLATLNRQRS